jgi:hypothetical protein
VIEIVTPVVLTHPVKMIVSPAEFEEKLHVVLVPEVATHVVLALTKAGAADARFGKKTRLSATIKVKKMSR